MSERGVIRNREHAQQLRDFSGLRFGKVTPTDIDGFLEFGNRLFVVIEGKYGGAQMPYGQRLALERLIDVCHKPPATYGILLVGGHNASGDVDYGAMKVTRYRWGGQWFTPRVDIDMYRAIWAIRKRVFLKADNEGME